MCHMQLVRSVQWKRSKCTVRLWHRLSRRGLRNERSVRPLWPESLRFPRSCLLRLQPHLLSAVQSLLHQKILQQMRSRERQPISRRSTKEDTRNRGNEIMLCVFSAHFANLAAITFLRCSSLFFLIIFPALTT